MGTTYRARPRWPTHPLQLHDRYGCLIKRKWQGQQSATRRYRWDAENLLEATEDSLTGSTRYQRDSQGQLTQENDTEYHYDLGGNRVPEGGQIEQDRLIRSGGDKRTYDALGAEIRITGPTTEHRTFDAEGQLIELKRPSLHITYGYDALGRRAWRKTDAGTTTYLWHNDVLLGEQSPEGQWQWYLRDPQTDEPLITLIDDQPYYYELDHRMMPLRLWDQGGQKVWEGNSDAWAKCQPDTLSHGIHQPLRLPGQFEDELTGIVQNRFRDYDPDTGRYLTPDPLGIKGGLNSYRYTPNPIDYVDPLGLASCDAKYVGPEEAEEGEVAAITEDTPEFQNLETAGAAAALARPPVSPPPSLPTAPSAPPPQMTAGNAANQATYASRSPSLLTKGLSMLARGGTLIGGLLYSPSLGGGLEEITTTDGTVYSKHGDERIWNASGPDGSQWQTVSPQEDMEYRTWLANGGDGSFEEWLAEGKSSGLSDPAQSGAEDTPVLGGRHRKTKIAGVRNGTESHHIIADDVSDIATNDALAIRMDREDHVYRTASWGNRKAAKRFRAQQKALVSEGKYDEALKKMGIDDVKMQNPGKYDKHIEQMLDSAPKKSDGSIDWSKFKKKK